MGLLLAKGIGALRGSGYKSRFLETLTGGAFAARFRSEGSPFAWLSTDKAEVAKYVADPLCGFRFAANGYEALLRLMRLAYAPKAAQKADMPVHFLSGADDPCMPDRAGFDAAVACMRAAGYRNVTGKVYPGMRHEIHNEPGREQVYADIGDILDAWRGER